MENGNDPDRLRRSLDFVEPISIPVPLALPEEDSDSSDHSAVWKRHKNQAFPTADSSGMVPTSCSTPIKASFVPSVSVPHRKNNLSSPTDRQKRYSREILGLDQAFVTADNEPASSSAASEAPRYSPRSQSEPLVDRSTEKEEMEANLDNKTFGTSKSTNSIAKNRTEHMTDGEADDDDASSVAYGGSVASNVTDRYGFFGGSQYTIEKGSNFKVVQMTRRRERKWLEMFDKWDTYMTSKYHKLRERCRKGIPNSLRGRAWLYLSGGRYLMEKNPGLYQHLLEQPGDPRWIDDIRKDLHRQFPLHEMFAETTGPGQESLFEVLKAYTVLVPEEGYCQGQAPLAALLIMHMPPESAFWCLVVICEKYLPKYYSQGMEAIQIDGDILYALLKKVAPAVHKHIGKQSLEPILYMMEWFLCVFTRTLPWSSVLRVWDMFLCEGVKVSFKVGLVLLKYSLDKPSILKKCSTMYETLEVLRHPPPRIMEEDFLLQHMLRLPLSEADLEHEHFRQMAKRKAAAKQPQPSGGRT